MRALLGGSGGGRWWGGLAKGLALGALALPLCGCYIKTQRLPAPMRSRVDPLPPGTRDDYPPGPEEVVVVRHADPVQLRPAGLTSSYPLHFHNRQTRANSGSWVFCGAGGRLEVLWPSGGTILFFDRCTGIVGSESRGEPLFLFEEVDRARLSLRPGERVRLLGGAELSVPSAEDELEIRLGGPYVIEHLRPEVLRITNRGKSVCDVAYREEVFRLDPGHVLDLPLLAVGCDPLQVDPGFQTLPGGVEIRGQVQILDDDRGTRLRAVGDHELRGYGVKVRLDEGEEALFIDLAGGVAGQAPPSGD